MIQPLCSDGFYSARLVIHFSEKTALAHIALFLFRLWGDEILTLIIIRSFRHHTSRNKIIFSLKQSMTFYDIRPVGPQVRFAAPP